MIVFNLQEGYTLTIVTTGAALLGVISGMVGTFAVLKKQSLLADAVSHASLPGIVIAFMITGVRNQSALLAGAAAVGWFAAFQVYILVSKEKLKQDSLLSLILSVYFGFGMVLLSYIQHKPGAGKTGIETFLFGQAATMLKSDVMTIGVVGLIIFLIVMTFKKEFTLLVFDPVYTASLGYPVFFLEVLFATVLVCSVVIGLQTVGIVLMSSMLVGPAVAARQWTNNINIMLALSGFFGCISGVAGTVVSGYMPNLPTGPLIIVSISIIAIFSILLAPKRGIYWRHRRHKLKYRPVKPEELLEALYFLNCQHGGKPHHHPLAVVESLFPYSKGVVEQMKNLEYNGLVSRENGGWCITDKGSEKVTGDCKDTREELL